MYFPTLFTSLLLIPFSSTIDILLPLYLYPGEGASAWSSVLSTISTHSDIRFQIIVNPNSGPGTNSFPTDANHITGISKLNNFTNVKTLGYVLTGYGNRDNAAVNADVDIYASWSDYTDADIHIDGIYFDEVSNDNTQANFDRMETLSKYARGTNAGASIVFNPGYRAPVQLFEFCDMMVEFEHPFADYKAEGILEQIEATGQIQKSAVQILETPEGSSEVEGLISEMQEKRLGAFFFGVDCCYKMWNNGLLEKMADAI
ncbi:MAG: hypothetical protein Q9221_002692 [Calogaya cf. arnoldii]